MSKGTLRVVVFVSLASLFLVGCPWLLKYTLTIQNFTGGEITALQLKDSCRGSLGSSCGNFCGTCCDSAWGENLLTAGIPGDGTPFAIENIAPGVYDLKATFDVPPVSVIRFDVPFMNDWLWLFSALEVSQGEYLAIQIIDTLTAK